MIHVSILVSMNIVNPDNYYILLELLDRPINHYTVPSLITYYASLGIT